MNDTEQNILKQAHSRFVRGYTMATLDSMYMAACYAAPWRKEDWKTLKHDLEEALTADWRREDQEAEADVLQNGDQSAVPEESRMHPSNWPQ